MIRWLHISDLHLGNDDMSSTRMRDKLLTFLTEKFGNFDYIFLTGDIRSANVPDNRFTQSMADFLKEVCKHCGVSVERLFIVPGNHDINRDVPERHEAIEKVKFGWKGYYDSNSGKIKDEDLTAIWKGQEDLRNFLSLVYGPDQLSNYQNPNAPHLIIETNDFNIIHLDTTVTYTKDQEAHDLIVGGKYLYDALKNINKKKPSILLSHYPITSLLQDEKKVVSEMLRDFGVRLWLCGHKHDQNLQPYKYLHMLQSGEVQYEKSGRASFLVGEYDQDTFKCNVNAYEWYPEGWAKYPFVDRDGEREDTYTFELRPLDEECVPKLVKLTRHANESSMDRLPKNLNKNLFPVIESDGCITDIGTLLKDSWNTANPNIILLGHGGMGKSTMLLDYCNTSSKPVLYISAGRLQAMAWTMEQYCISTLFDGNAHEFKAHLFKKASDPSLILILDGLNEVDAECERRLVQEVQRFSLLKGIQILIASRVDFTVRYNLHGYRKAIVNDLEDGAVQSFFSPEEWTQICNSGNLHRLLRNPMLVTIYKEFCTIMEEYRDIEFLDWIIPVETSTDLFHNHYLAQIALMMKRDGVTGEKLLKAIFCIYQILPAIAYRFEIDFSLNKQNKDFRAVLSEVISQEQFVETPQIQSIRERFREYKEIKLSEGEVIDILFEELHLIHRDDKETAFSHQMYRDYLSALYIISKSVDPKTIIPIWNSRLIPWAVGVHIRHGSGNYWNGIACKVKDAAINDPTAQHLVRNLFNCFPSSDKGGIANYSHLYLNGIKLPDLLPAPQLVSLENSWIDSGTLGLHQMQRRPYHVMRFSEDKQFLAAASDKSITIFNLTETEKPYFYNIGKKATQMVFYQNYLLINSGSIIVFKKEDGWRFIGEIRVESGGIFNSNFRALIGREDTLNIYYKKRELHFNLSDCTLIENTNASFSPQNVIDGTDLQSLKLSIDVQRTLNVNDGIVSICTIESLKAVSYADGRLELVNEGETIAILREGSSILMDAAISGDGTMAVTLSFATFKNGRRVQIWDIGMDKKIDEMYCHPDITHIHLSENGKWIIGIAVDNTWVYNLTSREGKWINTLLTSNQYNKLITYGDQVLIKDIYGGLQLFDLLNESSTPLKSPVKNPKIVCMMNNGSVAAIDDYGRYLKFRSDRDGHLVEQRDDYNEFIALQAFKSHPFLVAVTRERCSVYHTGTGQRLRKLEVQNKKVKFMVCHPSKTIFAYTDGNQRITIEYFGEKQYSFGPRGWWETYQYVNKSNSRILDMGFNEADQALIVIMADGTILRQHESNCTIKAKSQIITAFSTYAYDFRGVVCTPGIENILRQNDCL